MGVYWSLSFPPFSIIGKASGKLPSSECSRKLLSAPYLPGCFCSGSAQQCRAELRTLLLGHLWAEGGQVAPPPEDRLGSGRPPYGRCFPATATGISSQQHKLFLGEEGRHTRQKASAWLVWQHPSVLWQRHLFPGPLDPAFWIPLESPTLPWESPLVIMYHVAMATC